MKADYDEWAEERYFRRDAIKGSLKLLQALLRLQNKALRPVKQAKKFPPLPEVVPFPQNPTCRRIQSAVAQYYGFNEAYLYMPGRGWWHSHPRQVAMYLAHVVHGVSYPKIAKHFGRDHTTVIHACRAVPADRAMLSDSHAIQRMLTVPVKTGEVPDISKNLVAICDRTEAEQTQERIAA